MPTTSQTSGDTGAREAALSQYRGFWQALPKASRMPETQANALLERYLVDAALAKIEGTLASQRAFHKQLYGENMPRPTSVMVSDGTATVVDCQKSDAAGVEDASSAKRLTVGPARNPVQATLKRTGDGIWKIATITYPSGTC